MRKTALNYTRYVILILSLVTLCPLGKILANIQIMDGILNDDQITAQGIVRGASIRVCGVDTYDFELEETPQVSIDLAYNPDLQVYLDRWVRISGRIQHHCLRWSEVTVLCAPEERSATSPMRLESVLGRDCIQVETIEESAAYYDRAVFETGTTTLHR